MVSPIMLTLLAAPVGKEKNCQVVVNFLTLTHSVVVVLVKAAGAFKNGQPFFRDNAVEQQEEANFYLTKPNEMQFSTMSFSARPRRFCHASTGTM